MRTIRPAALLLMGLCFSLLADAQKKPAKKTETIAVQKFRAPKLQTYIDSYKDSVNVSADEALKIISLPLKIYDDKKNEYIISSYQFMYKKKVVTEDEKTGKITAASSIAADRFKISPLPDLWVNLIKQEVKAGEEFYFFDVIAKDTQGRVMYASNLKFIIQ